MSFQETTFPPPAHFHGGSTACGQSGDLLNTICSVYRRSGSTGAARATEKLLCPGGKSTLPHIYSRKRKCGLDVRKAESTPLNPQIFLRGVESKKIYQNSPQAQTKLQCVPICSQPDNHPSCLLQLGWNSASGRCFL